MFAKAPGVRSVVLIGDRMRAGLVAVVVPDEDFIRADPELAKAAETVRVRIGVDRRVRFSCVLSQDQILRN